MREGLDRGDRITFYRQLETADLVPCSFVVAAADLQLGSEIKRENLKVAQFPDGQAPEGAFTNPDELVGRGVIAPIVRNEPILISKLASKEAGAGLPPIIPAGMRAVSVRVNEVIGVAGYVLPGTRVDVVATVSPTDNHKDMTSKVILTDVQVLAAGTKLERDEEADKPMAVNVVTLLVNPDESERLTLAANEGKIQLALRNPLDKDNPVTKGVKPPELLGTPAPVRRGPRALPMAQAAAAAPAAPAPEPTTVEIIRGDKRAREVVRD